MGIVEQYLTKLNTSKRRSRRSVAFLAALSLIVMMAVSWNLRQTGIAIANGATCGIEEHQHDESCVPERVLICGYDTESPTVAPVEEPTEVPTEEATEVPTEEPTEVPTEVPTEEPTEVPTEAPAEAPTEETAGMTTDAMAAQATAEHTHSDACYEITYQCGLAEHTHALSCYSDINADLENWDIWMASIPELTGQISKDIVLVAQSQLGIRESENNFEPAEDGQTRNGITRYGQWYGNPYGPWSNMFTSFCLRFAGLNTVPVNSGAEKMQMEWEALNLYRHAGGYEPVSGDIVFLDKNQNGTVESTGIVVRYFDFVLTVIEGDVDNAVVQQEYRIDDPMITGYGITNSAGRLMMLAAGDDSEPITIGTTTNYPNNAGTFILYVTIGGESYAIDRDGNTVPITIKNGNILADVADPATLYWIFTKTNNNYSVRTATQPTKYLNLSTDALLADTSQNLTLSTSGTGAKFYGGSWNNYYYLQVTENGLGRDRYQSNGSTIYFGQVPSSLTLWLDGTNGGFVHYTGTTDVAETVYSGVPYTLPTEWPSPTKYQYKLAGWVDISTGTYYKPGDTITITKNTVLYADWVAATYDIGQYNEHVVDTVSTNDFVTTYLFDYSSLINLNSAALESSSVSANEHSETWTYVQGGNSGNFAFYDYVPDTDGTLLALNNRADPGPNSYTGGKLIYEGIYNDALREMLFGTSSNVVGKHYLGTADHLFQINDEGYYYYDSHLNAASYNQSENRFYVYDYLARTTESSLLGDGSDSGKYSDFIPLNSPYINTNGQEIVTYNYNGTTNYQYDSKYAGTNSNNCDEDHASADFWFGMRVDVQFHLPYESGNAGNKDINGEDMVFEFAGDDDVWILVDGEVVLDLGGIHQEVAGKIDFATGKVTTIEYDSDGKKIETTSNLPAITSGEHTLSILYLERGGSMSNCSIYFNLAPRFGLELEKEDVLTQEKLIGAQFEFYYDEACTQPCVLWESRAVYKADQQDPNVDLSTNRFIIGADGKLQVWGLSPSTTYYIKEVVAPGREGYEIAKGVIKVTLDKNGLNSYGATVLPDSDGKITNGFTVHGYQVDEELQRFYLTITNAQNWIKTTTSVYVEKKWNDKKNHDGDAVTVYLQVTDPDGTVRRIRQIDLSDENEWNYTWTNLPKYRLDPSTGQEYIPDPNNPEKNAEMTYQYSVVEAYVPGYQQSIGPADSSGESNGDVEWEESVSFSNGQYYILKTGAGCLSTVSETSNTLQFVDEATAKNSDLAIWKATVSGNLVRLTNKAGQTLRYYSANNRTRYFDVIPEGEVTETSNLIMGEKTGSDGIVLSYVGKNDKGNDATYYLTSKLNIKKYLEAKDNINDRNVLVFQPMQMKIIDTGEEDNTTTENDNRYRVTNTPLTSETSVKVHKDWVPKDIDPSAYQQLEVTVKLFYRIGDAGDWIDTGRTETLDLRSGWEALFQGLPYQDDNGNVYQYRIEEVAQEDWIPVYGEVTQISGTNNWQVTLTNHYRWTDAYELPSTGGIGYPLLILCGLPLVLAPLVYGLSLRRRYRKGARE